VGEAFGSDPRGLDGCGRGRELMPRNLSPNIVAAIASAQKRVAWFITLQFVNQPLIYA